MQNQNTFFNKLRKERESQELLLSFEDKKELINKEITKRVNQYKEEKGKNSDLSDIFLKRILLEALIIRMGNNIANKIIASDLLSEYNQKINNRGGNTK